MKIKDRKTYAPGSRDECASPPYAVIPLLNEIETYRLSLGISRQDFVIWEPATGILPDFPTHNGLVNGFRALGYTVFAPLQIDFIGIDFEDIDAEAMQVLGKRIRMIVTNPPFSPALKRRFVWKCDSHYQFYQVPWALLMLGVTHQEKLVRSAMNGTSIHVPLGRINFGMPNKGWGTLDEPTKATFSTAWYSKGVTAPNTITYDNFNMSDHFKAMNSFSEYINNAKWLDEELSPFNRSPILSD